MLGTERASSRVEGRLIVADVIRPSAAKIGLRRGNQALRDRFPCERLGRRRHHRRSGNVPGLPALDPMPADPTCGLSNVMSTQFFET